MLGVLGVLGFYRCAAEKRSAKVVCMPTQDQHSIPSIPSIPSWLLHPKACCFLYLKRRACVESAAMYHRHLFCKALFQHGQNFAVHAVKSQIVGVAAVNGAEVEAFAGKEGLTVDKVNIFIACGNCVEISFLHHIATAGVYFDTLFVKVRKVRF